MKLVKAQTKQRSNFPPQEFCCDAVIPMQEDFGGRLLTIDLDDTMSYEQVHGHCGQALGYKYGVKVVDCSAGQAGGYIPFELMDIDEGESVAV